MREHFHSHSRRQPIMIAVRMFEVLTQPLTSMLEMANVHTIIVTMQGDDKWEYMISDNETEDPRESTVSSVTQKDDLDHPLQILCLGEACHNKRSRSTRVTLPKTQSVADTLIPRYKLLRVWYPAKAIAHLLFKSQMSIINMLCKSELIAAQALPIPRASGDQNVPQTMASGHQNVPQTMTGGDHIVCQYQKAPFEIVNGSWRQLYLQRLLCQSCLMRSIQWLMTLGN